MKGAAILSAFFICAAFGGAVLAAEDGNPRVAGLIAEFDKKEKPSNDDATRLTVQLTELGQSAVPSLVQAMEDAANRESVATGILSVALIRQNAGVATPAFLKVLATTENLSIKRNMLAALRTVGETSAIPPLLKMLRLAIPEEKDGGRQETQNAIREDTILALQGISTRGSGSSVLGGELIQIVLNAEEPWKIEIVRTLKDIRRRESEDILLMLLADSSKSVSYLAAGALGTAGSFRCGPALIHALDAADPDRRIAACTSLGMLKHLPAVPFLIKVLKTKDPKLTSSALYGLRAITGRQFSSGERWQEWYDEEQKDNLSRLQVLEAQLRTVAPDRKPSIIEAMGELVFARDKLLALLQSSLDNTDPKIRAATVNALAQSNDPRVPRMLLAKMNDPAAEVSYGAWRALKFITGQNGVFDVQLWTKILDKRG